MASLQSRLESLAAAIGTDVKGVRTMIGVLANLNTTSKNSLVAALNELLGLANATDAKIGGALPVIGNAVGVVGDRTVVQALAKLLSDISIEATSRTDADGLLAQDIADLETALNALINDAAVAGNTTQVYSADKVLGLLTALESKILGGMAPEMLDTIKELADYLTGEGVAGGIVTQLSKKVDVSMAQVFTAAEQLQARENINAASQSDLNAMSSSLGTADTDYVAVYEAAKV